LPFITLIGGGALIVWESFRGILRKHFASDIVAMMAIIAAILLNDALPGVVIVIMVLVVKHWKPMPLDELRLLWMLYLLDLLELHIEKRN